MAAQLDQPRSVARRLASAIAGARWRGTILGAVKRCCRRSQRSEFDRALDEIGWSPDPITTSNLATLLDTTDELMAAEKVFGANHPSVASMLLKFGEQCCNARKYPHRKMLQARCCKF